MKDTQNDSEKKIELTSLEKRYFLRHSLQLDNRSIRKILKNSCVAKWFLSKIPKASSRNSSQHDILEIQQGYGKLFATFTDHQRPIITIKDRFKSINYHIKIKN